MKHQESQKDPALGPEDTAIRAHDITLCLQGTSVPDFDLLTILGLGVRLSLHLRGVPAIKYDVLRKVAVYLLDFPSTALRPVLEALEEAEMVRLDTEGKTIKTVVPEVPYYEQLFSTLAGVIESDAMSEPEQLTLEILNRLSKSPLLRQQIYELGAERKLVDRVLEIGQKAAYIVERRARGNNVLLSPTYFPESADAFSDLVAGHKTSRVARVLELLKENQGWPLRQIETERELGGVRLDDAEIAVIKLLAGEGFVAPPVIKTTHAGENHFLFGPRPGPSRLPAFKRPVYEAAMALVAAVRQGQLLPRRYAIRSPTLLLTALRDRRVIRANTEAMEQYRQLVALKVGRLEPTGGGWAQFHLIDRPENLEAVGLAIVMVSHGEPNISANEEVVLALRSGQQYVESLVGRKLLAREAPIEVSPEDQETIDNYLLRGRA